MKSQLSAVRSLKPTASQKGHLLRLLRPLHLEEHVGDPGCTGRNDKLRDSKVAIFKPVHDLTSKMQNSLEKGRSH